MNTPIADFVRGYEKQNVVRLHMPGHKGKAFVGCESMDITEVKGADALYEADGIIAESEANATQLFGTGRTIYSTEGSSQCIRAMLYLAMMSASRDTRPIIVATRNAHKSFVQAVALLDLNVEWIYPEGEMSSLCSCQVSPDQLEVTLEKIERKPIAVYVTSPDYLGKQLDIGALAEVCHRNGTILAVDNAHGAYLHFLNPSQHPIDLGADICCDSAHKTLPILTGGAYLQISKHAPQSFTENAKQAMALFGSTSPSYLTLYSLDLCNQYLADGYKENLKKTIGRIEELRNVLRDAGWQIEDTDPLKLTLCAPQGVSGIALADKLREGGVECEYADAEYVVCMFTPENGEKDYISIRKALGKNRTGISNPKQMKPCISIPVMSIREAVFARHEEVSVEQALGRVCGVPTVSCPPAISIVLSGERIGESALRLLKHYGIKSIEVVEE